MTRDTETVVRNLTKLVEEVCWPKGTAFLSRRQQRILMDAQGFLELLEEQAMAEDIDANA